MIGHLYKKRGVDVDGLKDTFKEKLNVALYYMPEVFRNKLTIGSAKRSSSAQRWLYFRYRWLGGPLAARPGTSMHELGRAVDFHPFEGHSMDPHNVPFRHALTWVYENGPEYGIRGLTRDGKHDRRDMVHFEEDI